MHILLIWIFYYIKYKKNSLHNWTIFLLYKQIHYIKILFCNLFSYKWILIHWIFYL